MLEIAASITSVYSLQLTISSHAPLSDTNLILSVKDGLGKFLTHSSRDASSDIGGWLQAANIESPYIFNCDSD